MFLHEANNQNDLENVLTLMRYMEVFMLKNGNILTNNDSNRSFST